MATADLRLHERLQYNKIAGALRPQ